MAYIIVKFNHEEIDRRALDGLMVVGRAPDCDIAIRDILLSRHHCRFEFTADTCTVTDLGSKNGTFLNGQPVREMTLINDGDVVRLGRSKLVFHEGDLDADLSERITAPARPADPSESLSGTLSGFNYLQSAEARPHPTGAIPTPLPRPRDPESYEREDMHELLSALASSSWDSIYAQAKLPVADRPIPKNDTDAEPRRFKRPRSPVDLSLQVSALPGAGAAKSGSDPDLAIVHAADEDLPPAHPSEPVRNQNAHGFNRNIFHRNMRLVAAALWLVAGFLLIQYFAGPTDPPNRVIASDVAPGVHTADRPTAPQPTLSVIPVPRAESAPTPMTSDKANVPHPAPAAPLAPLYITINFDSLMQSFDRLAARIDSRFSDSLPRALSASNTTPAPTTSAPTTQPATQPSIAPGAMSMEHLILIGRSALGID